MKKIWLMLVAVIYCSHLQAQEIKRAVTDNVTVYFNGGLIEKHLTVNLKKGDNTLILEGNSPLLWERSVQFEANDDFMLTDFNIVSAFNTDLSSYEESLSPKDRIQYKKLNDTIARLKDDLKVAKDYQSVLKKESATLSALKLFSNPQSQDSLAEIKATLDYFRSKMSEITKEEIENNRKIEQITKSLKEQEHLLNVLKERYSYLDPQTSLRKTQSRIIANIYAEKDIPSALIKYSYVVGNVFWEPSYDMKISSENDDVLFVLKARLTNNSAEDWLDVNLTFAGEEIGNESQVGVLSPNNIKNLANNNLRSNSTVLKSKNIGFVSVTEEMEEQEESLAIADRLISNYTAQTSATNGLMGQAYTLGHKHTIKSNGSNKTIALTTNVAKMSYSYIIKPKLSSKAYLQAMVADWQKLGLTDASAYVYFDNKMSGETLLVPSETQTDTLSLSLGADKRISVNRRVNKTTPKKTSMIGKEVETIVEVSMQIKNNSLREVELDIEDQIPVSDDVNIKIKALDLQAADYDSVSGKLQWKKRLKAGESLNLKIRYSVLYPKDYVLNLD